MNRPEEESSRQGKVFAIICTAIATIAVAAGVASFEIKTLQYGWVLFLAIPYFIGFFAATLLRFSGPKKAAQCYTAAFVSAATLALGFLVFGLEGLVCIAMAIPIAAPIIFVGAYSAYMLVHERALLDAARTTGITLLSLAACLWAERQFPLTPPTFTVTDRVTISASQSDVWDSLISLGSLGQPNDWLFRVGIACPQRVDIYGRGEGAMRVCTLSTGLLHERITIWQPGARLRWVSVSTPAPLKELNPFREVDPPHLHGFYRSVGGEFELRAVGPGRTEVIRGSSYQHHMFPAWYWRIWCDYVASRGHIYVLGVLRDAAERHTTPSELRAQR